MIQRGKLCQITGPGTKLLGTAGSSEHPVQYSAFIERYLRQIQQDAAGMARDSVITESWEQSNHSVDMRAAMRLIMHK